MAVVPDVAGLCVAALSGMIQGCRSPLQNHDVLGVLRGRCRECGSQKCPLYKLTAGLGEVRLVSLLGFEILWYLRARSASIGVSDSDLTHAHCT